MNIFVKHGIALISALAICLISLHCATNFAARGPEFPETLPSLDFVSATLPGTWQWQKPEDSPLTFDTYYDFNSDGNCQVRLSPDDTAVMRTTFSVTEERSRWSGRPIIVIRVGEHVAWELLSISPDSFRVRHGGIDLTIIDTYARVR